METSTAVMAIPKNIPAKIADQITSELPQISRLLPKDLSVERFQAGLWLQFTQQPDLAKCSEASIARAVIRAATKGLEPGRDCSIVPFRSRKGAGSEANLIEEYLGVLRRLDRTGRVLWPKAEPVFERDHFICDELAEVYEFRRHLGGDRGKLVCYFAAVKLKGHEKPIVRVCTIEEVDEVKRNMNRSEYDAWVKWPYEMGRKTAIKKLGKYLQLIDDVDDEDSDDRNVVEAEAHRAIADLYGDDLFEASDVDLETGEIVTKEEDTGVGDKNVSDTIPEADKAYDEWHSRVVERCATHEIDLDKLISYICRKYDITSLQELPDKKRQVVWGWVSGEGGRSYLKRELGVE